MKCNPYLFFDGRCKEAFEHYAEVLGGRIVAMMPYAGSPGAETISADWGDKIMHGRLVAGDDVLMGADAPPDRREKPGGYSMSISVDDPAEAERIFSGLVDGGSIEMPMGETFFAHRFGMGVDRFGIPWMVICEKQR